MAKEMNEMRANQGSSKLPSQTMINPRENASAITLRSGRKLKDPRSKVVSTLSSSSHSDTTTLPTISHSSLIPLSPKNAPQVSFKDPLVSTIPTFFQAI